jgi:hypothetical protein
MRSTCSGQTRSKTTTIPLAAEVSGTARFAGVLRHGYGCVNPNRAIDPIGSSCTISPVSENRASATFDKTRKFLSMLS